MKVTSSFASLVVLACAWACVAPPAESDGLDTPGDGVGGGAGGSPSATGGSPPHGAGGSLIVVPEETGGSGGGSDPACDSVMEIVLRDFNADHPDFEETFAGQDDLGCGLVMPTLDTADGKRQPTFQGPIGTGQRMITGGVISCITPWPYTPPNVITSALTFADWYNDVPGVNMTIESALDLMPSGTGTYVFDSAGTPGFFPLDGQGSNETTQGHNFHFTTEAHMRFGYEQGQIFTFSGDDDLWIFVNDTLALDLGGLHGPLTATLDFDAQAAELGISPGNTYNMDIFHAERHTSASNFRIETNISCFTKVVVVR